MIGALIPEEIEGIKEYKYIIENCESEELRDFAKKALEDEKKTCKVSISTIRKNAR